MDWIYRMQEAITYIEDHLYEDINCDEIARSVCSSSFHFQRIFSLITGVTINEYIRNRRLSLAGQELYTTKAKIIDIAYKYCYDTPESFTKAFTRFHGVTPSTAREFENHLKTFNPILIQINKKGSNILDYKIEVKDEFIGNKSKILKGINIQFRNSWAETASNDFLNSLVAALYYIDQKYTTEYVMGATGAAFNSYWCFGSNNCCDILLMGDKFIEKAFHNLRFYYTHLKKDSCANWKAVTRTKIVESIDNDYPVLLRFSDGYSVICGYDNNGNTIYGTKCYYATEWPRDEVNDYFIATHWDESTDNVILLNGKKPQSECLDLLAEIFEWAIHLLSLPSFYNYENNITCFNGISCYDHIIAFLRENQFLSEDMNQLRYWCEEVFNNVVLYNNNKRKFAALFLNNTIKECRYHGDYLEKAALEFDQVSNLYKVLDKNALYSWLPDDTILQITNHEYRHEIIKLLEQIKHHETRGLSFMEQALQMMK